MRERLLRPRANGLDGSRAWGFDVREKNIEERNDDGLCFTFERSLCLKVGYASTSLSSYIELCERNGRMTGAYVESSRYQIYFVDCMYKKAIQSVCGRRDMSVSFHVRNV